MEKTKEQSLKYGLILLHWKPCGKTKCFMDEGEATNTSNKRGEPRIEVNDALEKSSFHGVMGTKV